MRRHKPETRERDALLTQTDQHHVIGSHCKMCLLLGKGWRWGDSWGAIRLQLWQGFIQTGCVSNTHWTGIRGEQEGRGAIKWGGSPMQIYILHVVDLHTSTQGKNNTKSRPSRVQCIAAKRGEKKPSAAELKSKCCKSSCAAALIMASLTLRRFALTCWSGSEIIGSTKKIIKRQKHQRAQIATVIAAAGWAGCSAKCVRKKKRNYLIHTNCMYSLVVNFDKEESSKWERTKKIQVTVRKNMICNTEFWSGRVQEKNVTADYSDCLNGNTQCVCKCVV